METPEPSEHATQPPGITRLYNDLQQVADDHENSVTVAELAAGLWLRGWRYVQDLDGWRG